jgi:membrane associated rhomboid family serine protease
MFPYRDENPKHGRVYIIWALLLLNVLVFIYELSLNNDQLVRFVYQYGLIPRELFANPLSEFPSLISSMFLHGSLAHIFGNMLFLLIFADNIEDRLGHGNFLVFYLVGGASAALVHALFSASSSQPMVGASGAISAVLGAYFVLYPRHRIRSFILLPLWRVWIPARVFLGIWIVMQAIEAVTGVVSTSAMSNVAWWAHIGGFAFGALVIRRLTRPQLPPPPPSLWDLRE